MEGFTEYESLKQHAAWQRKLRLTAQYMCTKLVQNFQASISHGCNTFTILLILFSRTTGFYDSMNNDVSRNKISRTKIFAVDMLSTIAPKSCLLKITGLYFTAQNFY